MCLYDPSLGDVATGWQYTLRNPTKLLFLWQSLILRSQIFLKFDSNIKAGKLYLFDYPYNFLMCVHAINIRICISVLKIFMCIIQGFFKFICIYDCIVFHTTTHFETGIPDAQPCCDHTCLTLFHRLNSAIIGSPISLLSANYRSHTHSPTMTSRGKGDGGGGWCGGRKGGVQRPVCRGHSGYF